MNFKIRFFDSIPYDKSNFDIANIKFVTNAPSDSAKKVAFMRRFLNQ